jgi:hypothetical protein
VKINGPATFGLLFAGSRYSRKGFARAVNSKGRELYGISLSYTHTHVSEWIRGAVPKYPDVVAAVLSEAWTIDIPPTAIWPSLAAGQALGPSPLTTPWISSLTVEEMSSLVGSELMFDRRSLLEMFAVATGASLVHPVRRWLAVPSTGVVCDSERRPGQIDLQTVADFEKSAVILVKCNLEHGGRLFRSAATEELREAVGLIRDARYTEDVGRRLFGAAAYLSNLVGCMSFDIGLQGVAQRYFLLGLKLAREADDPTLTANILGNLAEQMRDLGNPVDGLDLVECAFRAGESGASTAVLARMESLRGTILAELNRAGAARRAVGMSFEILADQNSESRELPSWAVLCNEAELHSIAGSSFRRLASQTPSSQRLLDSAREHTETAIALRDSEFVRSHLFDTVGLARISFISGEPEEGIRHTDDALATLPRVNSVRAVRRISGLRSNMGPYSRRTDVADLRERIHRISDMAIDSDESNRARHHD